MPLDEPGWWYGNDDAQTSRWPARLLAPVGWIYGAIAEQRYRRTTPYRSRLPVICIGNFTAGGTGKTPLSLIIGDLLQAQGRMPVFLSRGYGGHTRGPVVVDRASHSADDVGDEPLLLAAHHATVVSRNRADGARFIEAQFGSNTVIVMDDGLQNSALAKSLSIAVVDAVRGVGNGRCIPAGPLRAPLAAQMPRVDILAVSHAAPSTHVARTATAVPRGLDGAGPLPSRIDVRVVPKADSGWLRGARVVAFAGIANPDRFFALLEQQGATLAARHVFADHHAFDDADAARLLDDAARLDATLVTTEKDRVRLAHAEGAGGTLRDAVKTVAITLALSDRDQQWLFAQIADALAHAPASR
ncbi:MAG: tetraacyldisaccharide 4'-kinase [Hyphomicrobium sp.]